MLDRSDYMVGQLCREDHDMVENVLVRALPQQRRPRLFSLSSLKTFAVLLIAAGSIASIVLLILGVSKPSGGWIAGAGSAGAYALAAAQKTWREGNKTLAACIGVAGAIAMAFVLLCVALIKYDMLSLRFGYTEAVISIMTGIAVYAIFQRTEGTSFDPRPQGGDRETAPRE